MDMMITGIAIYTILILFIAYRAGRKETSSEFMIGGRKFGTLSLSFSMAAAYMGAGMLTWTTSVAYTDGLAFLGIYIGVILGFVPFYLAADRIKKLADKHNFYTMTDMVYYFCGHRTGVLLGFVMTICYIGFSVLQMVVGARLLETLFEIDYGYGVLFMGCLTTLYLYMGGFKAVVRTDIVQYLVVLLVCWFVVGDSDVQLKISESNWSLDNVKPISIGITALYLVMLNITWADIWQRIYAAKSTSAAKKGILGAVSLICISAIVVGVMGMATKAAFPDIAASDAFIYAFGELLPNWMGPFAIILLLSVIMSTLDTCIFLSSLAITNDSLKRLNVIKGGNERKASRIAILIMAVIAGTIAYMNRDILDVLYSIFVLLVGMFPPVMSFMLLKKVDEKSVFWVTLLTAFGVIYLISTGQIGEKPSLILGATSTVVLLVWNYIVRLKTNKLESAS